MHSNTAESFPLKNFILAHPGCPDGFSPETDHVWEVTLANGQPAAFTCQTTYGLRARSMRLFPGFISGGSRITDPGQCIQGPAVNHYCPNFLQIMCEPVPGAVFHFDLHLFEPDVLTGRIRVKNAGGRPVHLELELCAILLPMARGTAAMPAQDGINQILTGQTEGLTPVLFMTGGPHATHSPYPALGVPIALNPGEQRTLSWALAAKSTQPASLVAARQAAAESINQKITTLLMAQQRQTVHITTGNAHWDAAFELAQTSAHNHLVARKETREWVVKRTRLPDDSPHGGRPDLAHDALTALEAWHLSGIFLPSSPDLMIQIVNTFLKDQGSDGALPSRLSPPGLGLTFQELPFLSQICLEVDACLEDPGFLKSVFPALHRALRAWFLPQSHPDMDGIPTLENPAQLQMESGLFNFDIWEPTGRGLDIRQVESPGLAALLHRETLALAEIARRIRNETEYQTLMEKAERLKALIQETWNPYRGLFEYRDAQTHQTTQNSVIYQGHHQDVLRLNHAFETPQRLHLELISEDERTRICGITLRGQNAQGEPVEEKVKPQNIRWVLGRAFVTSQSPFSQIDTIAVTGLNARDQIRIKTPDLTIGDISCLLPAWSGAAAQKQVESILKRHLVLEGKDLAWGIPETLKPTSRHPEDLPHQVNLLWNSVLISGLARMGFKGAAADLFAKLMTTIIAGLQNFEGFYPTYNALTGRPAGKRNLITGLPSLRLFLQIAGIRLYSPEKVALWGENPFPWPVMIVWRGLKIRREGPQTEITFPDGRVFTTDSTDPVLIQQ
jgi:hypothetical protein